MRVELPLEELEHVRASFPAGGKKLTAVAVYVAIAELAAQGREATNESIAARAGASAATIYNYLDPLLEGGAIEVEKPARGPWRYTPTAPPVDAEEGWRRQNSVLRKLLTDMGVTPAQIAAREAAGR